MGSCTACGEENTERARFCSACGQPLEEHSSERFRRTSRSCSRTSSTRPGSASGSTPRRSHHVLTDYFDGVKPVVERPRRDAREVHRRRGHGGVRPDRAPRGRRASCRSRGRRDAGDADASERRLRGALRRRAGDPDGDRHGHGGGQAASSPIATSSPATRRTAPLVSSRTPSRATSCSPSRRSGSSATSVEAELLPPLELKGKQQRSSAYRLLAVRERSELAPRLEAPLVGRRDTLAQLEWALERTVRRTDAGSSPSSARPGSASRGSPTSSSRGSASARRCSRDAACPTARASRSGRSRRWSAGGGHPGGRRRRGGGREARGAPRACRGRSQRRRGDRSAHRAPGDEGRRRGGLLGRARLFARLAAIARSSSCSTTRTGPRRCCSHSSRTSRATRNPSRSCSSASAGRTSSNAGRTGVRAPSRSTIVRLDPLDDAACDRSDRRAAR